MESLMKYVRMTFAAGILTLLSMFISVLALADIGKGENDLTLEWGAVRVTAFVILVFVALSFVTLRRAVQQVRKTTLSQTNDQ